MEELRIIIPKGSLNRIGRGNTYELFEQAGYSLKGYDPERESRRELAILDEPRIKLSLGRPQKAPYELHAESSDIGLIGADWVADASLSQERVELRSIGDLGYGGVKIIAQVDTNSIYESLSDFIRAEAEKGGISCSTEYVNLAADYFRRNPEYMKLFGNVMPTKVFHGNTTRGNPKVKMVFSDGITEADIEKGMANITVDNSHTGGTMREYGLRPLEQIMESHTGLYAGPSCVGWREEKAFEVYERLSRASRELGFMN